MTDILYVEDEQSLAMIVMDSLEINGFCVRYCQNGKEALTEFYSQKPDIVVLDVMMPVMDGFQVATEIRKLDTNVPVLFLTAKDQTEDVVHGFKIGGNDYVKKPFKIEELIVRIENLVKNNASPVATQFIQIGNYQLDTIKHTLSFGKQLVKLSYRESEILKKFVENKDQVIPREEMMLKYWSYNKYFTGRSLDVFISRIRKYVSEDERIKISNIRGIGYMLSIEE